MRIEEPPLQKPPLLEETLSDKRFMTDEDIAVKVRKRMKKEGKDARSSLAIIINEKVLIPGETPQEKKMYREKLYSDVIDLLKKEQTDQSSKNPRHTSFRNLPKKLQKKCLITARNL